MLCLNSERNFIVKVVCRQFLLVFRPRFCQFSTMLHFTPIGMDDVLADADKLVVRNDLYGMEV